MSKLATVQALCDGESQRIATLEQKLAEMIEGLPSAIARELGSSLSQLERLTTVSTSTQQETRQLLDAVASREKNRRGLLSNIQTALTQEFRTALESAEAALSHTVKTEVQSLRVSLDSSQLLIWIGIVALGVGILLGISGWSAYGRSELEELREVQRWSQTLWAHATEKERTEMRQIIARKK